MIGWPDTTQKKQRKRRWELEALTNRPCAEERKLGCLIKDGFGRPFQSIQNRVASTMIGLREIIAFKWKMSPIGFKNIVCGLLDIIERQNRDFCLSAAAEELLVGHAVHPA